MKNSWLKFGCFLTGYNYDILKGLSEIAAKSVKRYTSALLIVCILWTFIGYTFTSRYLHGSLIGCCAGAVIMVIIVIQIERQIILSVNPGPLLYFARGTIAVMMAIIGSVIIDQIILKEDIELEKISFIQARVNTVLPLKTQDLRSQIDALDIAIQKKDSERIKLIEEVGKTPMIRSTTTSIAPTKVTTTTTDSGRVVSSEKLVNAASVIITSIPNPKQSLIVPLEQSIVQLRGEKSAKEDSLLNIRPRVEADIKSRVGFLDELNVMAKLIAGSRVAMFVWLIWFFLLFGLEMLVLISKSIEKKNDYEETILHQMNLQMKKLAVLARLAQPES